MMLYKYVMQIYPKDLLICENTPPQQSPELETRLQPSAQAQSEACAPMAAISQGAS